MELLTPRELSQTTEEQVPTGPGRVTITDPSDTLGDPVVKKTMKQLLEAACRVVGNRSVPNSEVTAPYGTIDDTGREELTSEDVKKAGVAATTKSGKTSNKKIREMPMKKMSRVPGMQNFNPIKNSFTGVP